ncbi:MAG: TolC family outer membrane protein [Geminicoccaceae bacterium]
MIRQHKARLAFGLSLVLVSSSVAAQTFEETLVSTYSVNATLEAAKQELRAINETAPQALAGYRPSLSTFVRAGSAYEFTADDGDEAGNVTAAAGVTLSQPLYRGGRTSAGVDSAENQILSQREIYRATEQDVLLLAANAHLDVLRDQEIAELTANSETIIAEQLSAFRRQFQASAATKTDVAQGEARLARAQASLARAQAQLAASRATFVETAGMAPEKLLAPDTGRFAMPPNRDEMLARALDRNPRIGAAHYAEIASRFDVDVARGWSWPEVDLVGSLQYFSESADGDAVNLDDEFAIGRLEVRVTVPLYEGTYGSRSRQSSRVADQRRAQLLAARRQVEREAAGAWESWTSAQAQVEYLSTAVASARAAVDGLRKEHRLGERTALDLLNGEQEFLDAAIDLTEAKRDLSSARFGVLAALGAFTVDQLELDTQAYDAEADFQDVRDRWF